MEQWIISNYKLIVDVVYYYAIFMMFEGGRLIVVLCDWLDFYQHPERNSVMTVLVPIVLTLAIYVAFQLETIGI